MFFVTDVKPQNFTLDMKLKHFTLAKRLSKLSDHHTFKHGACIAVGNKVIGIGFNKMKTSPKSTHPYGSLHAEVVAILNAGNRNLSKATLYVYREIKNGNLADSRPCKYCEKAIKAAGIKEVCFTIDNGFKKTKVMV